MQGCRGRRDQSGQERPCGSASSPGHAFCPPLQGWSGGGPAVRLVEAGCHHPHLHAAGSSGEQLIRDEVRLVASASQKDILVLSRCAANYILVTEHEQQLLTEMRSLIWKHQLLNFLLNMYVRPSNLINVELLHQIQVSAFPAQVSLGYCFYALFLETV